MRLRGKPSAGDNAQRCLLSPASPPDNPINRLRCLNCGQQIFVAAETEPPEICQYCDDMTTWQMVEA